MKKIVVIPTLNENKNIDILFSNLLKLDIKFDLLFIDDNSKDGTRKKIIELSKKNQNIKFIFRKKKLGVGSAHKVGINFAYKKKYKILITMDADGTHNPKYIPQLIKLNKYNSIVITNRFLSKNSIIDWPISRRLLTKIRYHLINYLLNIRYDTSGAFRCYNLNIVKKKDILAAKDNGYSFFWESIFILHKKKYKIHEIPVDLPYRKIGSSKMKLRDIVSSLYYLSIYFFKNLFFKIK
ncbi:glycosyltransferase [Candidatus Pelagibacter sp.]|uniref:glycosyltransferase n=1 Tax=Candidatus Pelagibacter sp. TaxID=2024849 RepID=UPI003F852C8D